jgi:hypothetical protein
MINIVTKVNLLNYIIVETYRTLVSFVRCVTFKFELCCMKKLYIKPKIMAFYFLNLKVAVQCKCYLITFIKHPSFEQEVNALVHARTSRREAILISFQLAASDFQLLSLF